MSMRRCIAFVLAAKPSAMLDFPTPGNPAEATKTGLEMAELIEFVISPILTGHANSRWLAVRETFVRKNAGPMHPHQISLVGCCL